MRPFPLTRVLDRRAVAFLVLLGAIAIAVPVLYLSADLAELARRLGYDRVAHAIDVLLPPSSPLHLSTYFVTLFGKYICYALLALSIDLIWGYCGILSLGHGAFFALGGYAMGMYLMRQIGTRGVYAHPVLPDFMVFLNWPDLPVYWYGFQYLPYALLMVVLVPGLLAFVFGWFAFRSRVTGVYLSIITQALTFALMLGFFRNNFGFGGNNGLTDFKDILGFNVQAPGTRAALFAASIVALMIGFAICRAIVTSKLGKVLIAIRDAEARTRFLGYRVESYKLFVFTLSACMAGVAGALYVPQVGIINPSEFSPANSIEAVIWVAVGGRGTLTGAIIGAVLVNYAKTTFTSGTPIFLWAVGTIVAVSFLVVLFARPQARASLIIGALASAALAALALPFGSALPAGWPFWVAGICLIAALATSWQDWPVGALFGALLVGLFHTPYTTVPLAPYWLFALGGLFVAVTLLLPRGVVGTIQHWNAERRARRAAAQTPLTEPAARPAE
jgi:urea transport system permease protein